jgi:hypothetical protein
MFKLMILFVMFALVLIDGVAMYEWVFLCRR